MLGTLCYYSKIDALRKLMERESHSLFQQKNVWKRFREKNLFRCIFNTIKLIEKHYKKSPAF